MPSPEALLAAAHNARARAYAPYSGFAVGAALETADGTVVTAGNVENVSLGLSICAERAVIVSAIAGGYRKFTAIAVAGPDDAFVTPCGACRQFIAEFDANMIVAYESAQGVRQTTIAELLPLSFAPEQLHR